MLYSTRQLALKQQNLLKKNSKNVKKAQNKVLILVAWDWNKVNIIQKAVEKYTKVYNYRIAAINRSNYIIKNKIKAILDKRIKQIIS